VALDDIDTSDLALGDVESAASSARMLTNVIARKKQRS
jgi:hypothetical protein